MLRPCPLDDLVLAMLRRGPVRLVDIRRELGCTQDVACRIILRLTYRIPALYEDKDAHHHLVYRLLDAQGADDDSCATLDKT